VELPNMPRVTIVVPVLNEADAIGGLLDDLRGLAAPAEIIVVDGGSVDGTRGAAEEGGALVVTGARGRGAQLRLGAERGRGPLLCFLHADVRLGSDAIAELDALIADWRAGAHAFRLRIDAAGTVYRVIEWVANLRSRYGRLPYGDQGLIVRRSDYEAVGGYPPLPLMEDVALVRALRRMVPIRLLGAPILVSARRWERDGPILRSVRNGLLLLAYFSGRSPEALARRYRAPSTSGSGGTVLALFAKAPVPGRVKTRLAKGIGEEAAARVYEASLLDVVETARRSGIPLRLFVDDLPAAGDYFSRSFPGIRMEGQAPGDLGTRLVEAFERLFGEGAERAIVMGSDSPTLPADHLRQAAGALDEADAVVGPAEDGGYYLLGLNRRSWPAAGALFQGIDWSTERVLDQTLRRAAESSITIRQAPTWYDIDTAADLWRALSDRPGRKLEEVGRSITPPDA
jgi:rSAM/selenodomain-associated transferase 2/rSAM/selenodomain-associated transferase 1